MFRPSSSAGTFMVAKKDASRLREAWAGNLISAASAEPTSPRLLADPSALIALESSWDRPIYVSTRDGAYFCSINCCCLLLYAGSSGVRRFRLESS